MKLFRMAVAIFCFSAGLFAADEKPASPQNFTHRVTGLFSPDREADLRAAVGKIAGVTFVSVDFEHAEVVLSYDPAAAFKGTKADKIPERLDNEVRNASSHTLGIQPLVTTPREQLTRVEIPVAGLDCKACCLAAYESISKIEGVAQATASFKEGRITALIDPAKTNKGALEEALKKRNVQLKTP
jgi:copper chaperone CopZ